MPDRAIVIAHRGASGYMPEHTLVGKALAYGLGADYLEQDVIATRDAELVVLHDIYLDDVTDAATVFPDRRRADGHFYALDFDLAELRLLSLSERRRSGSDEPRFPLRFPLGMQRLRIATLDEELQLIRGLNRSTGRNVGIYPEIKDPAWHRQHGIDLAALVVRKLADYDYRDRDDAVFLQCFDAAELERVRHELGCKLRLIQLVGSEPAYANLLTPAGLQRVASYAYGLGPSYAQLATPAGSSKLTATPLLIDAHAAGLRVHAYTFRRDDLPPYATSLEGLLEAFFGDLRLDGAFCDHPDIGVRVRDSIWARRTR